MLILGEEFLAGEFGAMAFGDNTFYDRDFVWRDTGTMGSLLEKVKFLQMVEKRQGIKSEN